VRLCAALSIFAFFLSALFILLAANALFYLIYVPREKTAKTLLRLSVSYFSYLAGILSLLRLPFAALPYIAKLLCYLALRKKFKAAWNSSFFQSVRLAGDFLNLGLSFLFWSALLADRLLVIFALAECIRLISEKGFIVFSALWQRLPLEKFERRIQRLVIKNDWLDYYALPPEEKIDILCRAVFSYVEVDQRFRYFSRFKILPAPMNLRAGSVRGIARGEIFIHAAWLNDPWLCLGMCARRSAWIFDPRRVPRPFYYRSAANRLMTEFALEYADLFPPFAVYQLGHEIKSARFGIFFKLARAFSFELESYVQKDGTYKFDPLLARIGFALGFESEVKDTPLYADATALFEIINKDQAVTPAMVAEEYSYPLLYVEEVLWREVESAREKITDRSR
jgi:hypothetical protein